MTNSSDPLQQALSKLLAGPCIRVPEQLALKTRMMAPGHFQFIGGNGVMVALANGETLFASGSINFSQLPNVSRLKKVLAIQTVKGIDQYFLKKSSSSYYQSIVTDYLMSKNPHYFQNGNIVASKPPRILQPLKSEIDKEIQHVLSDIAAITIRSDKKRKGKDGVQEVGISGEAFAIMEADQRVILKEAFHEALSALNKAKGISPSTSKFLQKELRTLIRMLTFAQKNENSSDSIFRMKAPFGSSPQKKRLIEALNLRAIKMAQLKGLEMGTEQRASIPKNILNNDTPQQLESLKNYLVQDIAKISSKYISSKNPAKKINNTTYTLIQDELIPFILMVLEALEK